MGSFDGHALPGACMLVLGVWWLLNIFYRYHMSQMRKTTYTATITYPFACCSKRRSCNTLPWEGMLKLMLSAADVTLELIEGLSHHHSHGSLLSLHTKQHLTVLSFFLLSGTIDILVYFRVPLPPAIDHVVVSLAFASQTFVYSYHLYARTGLDRVCHVLLIYITVACAVTVLAEIKLPHSVLLSLARAYFLCLQGTWFWQVGFILYNPLPGAARWDNTSHESVITATIFFAVHVNCLLIVVLATGVLMKVIVIKRSEQIAKSDADLEEQEGLLME